MIVLACSFALSACSFSTVDVKDTVAQKSIGIETLNFTNLYVDREKLKNDGMSTLFYERVVPSTRYQFSAGRETTLHYIFNAKKIKVVARKGNFFIAQIALQSGEYINIIASSPSNRQLFYIYGLSNKEFLKIAQNLEMKMTRMALREVVIPQKELTEWSEQKIFLYPIVKMRDGMIRR